MIAPAALRRCTAKASTSGRQSLNFGFPQVVGNPATPNCSLTVIETPSLWPPLAFSERRVGGSSGGACSVEIAHHDGVDLRIQRLDASDRAIDQFARRHCPRPPAPASSNPTP